MCICLWPGLLARCIGSGTGIGMCGLFSVMTPILNLPHICTWMFASWSATEQEAVHNTYLMLAATNLAATYRGKRYPPLIQKPTQFQTWALTTCFHCLCTMYCNITWYVTVCVPDCDCVLYGIDRHIEDYMSEKVSYVVTLEDWDANFDQVRMSIICTMSFGYCKGQGYDIVHMYRELTLGNTN